MMTEAERRLEQIAVKLEQWAREAERGGWSTQHVEPMRREAAEIWAFLGRLQAARH